MLSLCVRIRTWLKTNKIFFETVAAALLSIMAWQVSCTQAKIAKNQLILSTNPRILIELPKYGMGSSPGELKMFIKNVGLSELYDIRVYEDYFVTATQQNGSLGLVEVGGFITEPNSVISQLKPNGKEGITLNAKSINAMMKNFEHDNKGYQMRIVRLNIKYCRKLDGREFAYSKAYIMDLSGGVLLDYDERGIKIPLTPSFDDIKKALNAEG